MVDLDRQVVVAPSGVQHGFDIDPLRRTMMLEGLDDIGLTLRDAALIEAWQENDRALRPWIWNVVDSASP